MLDGPISCIAEILPHLFSAWPLGMSRPTWHQTWANQFDQVLGEKNRRFVLFHFWSFCPLWFFVNTKCIAIAHLAILFYCAVIDQSRNQFGITLRPGILSLGLLHPAAAKSPNMLALVIKSLFMAPRHHPYTMGDGTSVRFGRSPPWGW